MSLRNNHLCDSEHSPPAAAGRCAADRRPTFSVVTLGCPKNLVDTERMLDMLRAEGYRFTPEVDGADLVLVNTCGFIEPARRESLQAIEELVRLKRAGRIGAVIAAGCLAEHWKERLLEACPEVDRVIGVFARDEVARVACDLLDRKNTRRVLLHPPAAQLGAESGRLRVTAKHVAYLKIADGCDRQCSFCTIPAIRGPYVSKPIEAVAEEAQLLAADGVRELVLVAQDSTYYGIDLYGRPSLAQLVRRLDEVTQLDWIRLMYLYPLHFDDELIDAIAQSQRVVPYLDLPLQHIDDEILRRMRRGVTRGQTERLLGRLRKEIPGLVLRTTLIVGFPGETKRRFQTLVEFVRKWRFERLGVFPYSAEPDTPAASFEGQVPEKQRQRRCEELLAVQQEIAFAWNRAQVGQTCDVLLDAVVPGEANVLVGRTKTHAPDIDGWVYVTGKGLAPGQMVPCEIVAANGYDLVAAPVGQPR